MPMSKFFQSAFMSGELSPLIKGRVDIDQYYQGMQTAENVVIVPQGGLRRRPGTQHIDIAENIFSPFVGTTFISLPNGGIEANINDFSSSTVSVTTQDIGDLGTTSNNDYIVVVYDLSGETNLGKFIEVKDIKLSGTGSGVFLLQSSLDGTTYSTLKTITVTQEAQSFKHRVLDSNDAKHFRIIRTDDTGTLTGLKVSISEFNVLFPFLDTDDNQVASVAKTFDFSVESDRHYLGVLTGGLDTFEFNIVTGPAVVGTSYTIDSSTYRILSVVSNVAKAERTSGTNEPPSTGNFDGTIINYDAVKKSSSFGNMSFYIVDDQMKASPPNSINITEVLTTPFASSEVQDVRDVQTENVMLMFHMEHFPQRIINVSKSVFTIDDIPFLSIPKFDFNDSLSPTPTAAVQVMTFPSDIQIGDRFQIDVEGVLSKNITFAGDSGSIDQSSTKKNIEKNLQDMPIFGDDGIVVQRTDTREYTITLDGNSSGTYELFSAFITSGKATDPITFQRTNPGVPRSEDVWSDTRGYPRTAAFFQGRLWFGGSKSKRQSVFASRAGSFFDFFTEEGDDDEGIFVTISARNLTDIVDINPDRGLQIFTSGAEFLLTGNTPATIEIKAQTQHGSKFLEAKSLDGATLFIDKNGKTLRQYLYNYNEDAYNSVDISVLSSHLIDDPADLGVLSGSSTEDANYVVIINQDGTAAVLNTLRSQDINGFTKWTNGDTNTEYPFNIISVSTVHNDLFFVNKRVTDTTTTYSIERWDQTYLLDSGIKLLAPTSIDQSANQLILSSAHLTGFTVTVVARGKVLGNKTVAATSSSNQNGVISITEGEKQFILDGDSTGATIDVQIGFNFLPKVKSMPLNTTAGNIAGQNQMRDKKITRMNLRVLESAGVEIDGNTVPTLELGTSLNSDLTPFTGVIQDNNGGNGWNIEVVPEITVTNPMPFHLQAIEYEVQSS